MDTVSWWAREYEARSYALARIQRGQKRPTDERWTEFSFPADGFRDGDGVGLQSGSRSGNLVCIDLDSPDAVRQADQFLPPTGMVDGRPGKPRSHRWYVVEDVPADLTAHPQVAGGVGGPRTRQFYRGDGRERAMVVEFRGTGSQAVVPPSIWTSADGTRQEQRLWHAFDGPCVLDTRELYECVCRLAAACGWVPRETPRRARGKGRLSREEDVPPVPTDDAARQALTFLLHGIPPAVEGHGGDRHTFAAAAALVVDFGLTVEQALPVLAAWNRHCAPPWTLAELVHKLEAADDLPGERGWRVLRRACPTQVSIRPTDPFVFIGVDCAGDHSYISLPTMRAGHRTAGDRRELAPVLAAVDWQGRHVLLAPPSTVATNMREVWDEYYLARLLGQHGAASVRSIRLPPLDGRRRTLAIAGDVPWQVVPPPATYDQAKALAEEAGQRARETDAERRALPRRRASPKVEDALAFVEKHNVTSLTREMLQKARRKGITKDALRRALGRR